MSEETSRIAARERRVEQMRSLTLMSDTFMSVALRDISACQYVLRILTGIESLKVKEVRTQYGFPKQTPVTPFWTCWRRMLRGSCTIWKSSV